MNVKCKNCSGENPIGSIFCRLCGAKLSFEEIDADIKRNIKKRESKKTFRVIYRIIMLIFIVCAFFLAYLVLDPFHSAMTSGTTTKDQETEIVSMMSKIDSGVKGTYSLTSEQLNFLAKRYLATKEKNVSAEVVDGKYLKFSYSEIMFDYYVKIEISKTAIIEPVIVKNDKGIDLLSFKLISIKFGNLALPQYLGDFFADDFKSFASNSKVTRILKKVDKINISDNRLELIAE